MKKILVISWFFPPVNSSEGLVTYKLLNNSKYEYDVYTQNSNDSWSYGKNDFLPLNKNIKSIYSNASNLTDFYNEGVKFFENNKNKYDIVMTRSMPEESHMIGLEIKKIKPEITWIASFGDPIGNNPFTLKTLQSNNPYSLKNRYQRQMGIKEILSLKRILKDIIYKKNNKKSYNLFIKSKNILEKNIVKNADYIICNNDYQKKYIIDNNNVGTEKFIVLPHTFDEKLYSQKAKKTSSKIVFTYIGHLDDIRTPKLFLEAISDMYQEDSDLKDKVEFDFYGNMSNNDKLYIINNDLTDFVKIKKPISYETSLKIMKNSDWLLHIDANIFDILNENIFFAAKLADYIGTGNKIIGLTMLDGASADILRKINALILTYSKEEIKNYLYLIIYKQFEIKMNKSALNEYNAKVVSNKFDQFIENEVLNEN